MKYIVIKDGYQPAKAPNGRLYFQSESDKSTSYSLSGALICGVAKIVSTPEDK